MIKQTLALFCLMICAISSSYAVTHLVDSSGQLTGATGVNVDGTLFDVTFVDGTCTELFNGCDTYRGDFAFTAQGEASYAALALKETVFVNNALGEFDFEPQLINGCTDVSFCSVYTPFLRWQTDKVLVVAFASFRESEKSRDSIYLPGTTYRLFDTTADENIVYALWQPSAVPLPATAWLFISALGGLVAVKRKQVKS